MLNELKTASRVSTLTVAQSGDYRFDIEYISLVIISLFMQICKWIVYNYSLIFLFYDGGARQLAN